MWHKVGTNNSLAPSSFPFWGFSGASQLTQPLFLLYKREGAACGKALEAKLIYFISFNTWMCQIVRFVCKSKAKFPGAEFLKFIGFPHFTWGRSRKHLMWPGVSFIRLKSIIFLFWFQNVINRPITISFRSGTLTVWWTQANNTNHPISS